MSMIPANLHIVRCVTSMLNSLLFLSHIPHNHAFLQIDSRTLQSIQQCNNKSNFEQHCVSRIVYIRKSARDRQPENKNKTPKKY